MYFDGLYSFFRSATFRLFESRRLKCEYYSSYVKVLRVKQQYAIFMETKQFKAILPPNAA